MTSPERHPEFAAGKSSKAILLSRRMKCAVCGGSLEGAIDLPGLPLTDTYCREPVTNPLPGLDQQLLFCPDCCHGQLETQINPDILYGTNYCFRTSASATARKGTSFFLSTLEEVAPSRRFRCVLDLGCNDLFLLEQLAQRADVRIGIDPVWKGREAKCEDPSIVLLGSSIEEVNLPSLPAKPDLVLCRHTLEHIFDPCSVLTSLMESAAPDALYLFEVPGFDGLIERSRFDQVFHQHLQYFSLASFLRLLDRVGARYLLHRENYHDWGAIAVAFSSSGPRKGIEGKVSRPSLVGINRRYGLFKDEMAATRAAINELRGTRIFGYGAAQMLPILAYHMGTDFGELEAILDDDPAKDGIGYWNLPVRIVPSSRVKDMSDVSVLITAVDNVQSIMTKLLANRPRHILYPFHLI